MTKGPLIFRIFLLTLSLAALSSLFGCRPEEEAKSPQTKPVAVSVATLKAQDLPLIVEVVGRLQGNREVTLAAEVSGVVQSYEADLGDRVEAGRTLVRLDPTDYRLALEEAEANLAAARAQLKAAEKSFARVEQLLPARAIAPDDYDRIEAEHLAAQASTARVEALTAMARRRLEKTSIQAPFSGLIADRKVELGQLVAAGQPLMTIVDLSMIRVMIHLAEADYVRLDASDPVEVRPDACPGKSFPGRVGRIGVKADPMTNTFDVEIFVDNPDHRLKAGMTARVLLTVDRLTGVILVHQSVILYREDRREVFVVGSDGRAEKREVTLGRTDGEMIQVLQGLEPGDRLIVSGGQYLRQGSKITIVNQAERK